MNSSKTKLKKQRKATHEKKRRRSNHLPKNVSLLQKQDQIIRGSKKGNSNQFSRSQAHLNKNHRIIPKQSNIILNQKQNKNKKVIKNIQSIAFKIPIKNKVQTQKKYNSSFLSSQQAKLKTKAKTKQQTQPKTKPKPKTQAKKINKTNTKQQTQTKTKAKPKTKAKAKPKTKKNKDPKLTQRKRTTNKRKTKKIKGKSIKKLPQPKPISLRFTSRTKRNMKKTKYNLKSQLRNQRSRNGISKNNKLFMDKYAPVCEQDLSIHSGKRKAVKNWINYCFSLTNNRYRRNTKGQILILSGPVGCGKTALVRALCSDLNCEIAEWREPIESSSRDENYNYHINPDSKLKSLGQFLSRAQMYQPLDFIVTTKKEKRTQTQTQLKRQERPLLQLANQKNRRRTHSSNNNQTTDQRSDLHAQKTRFPRKIILLEELPILVGYEQKAKFNDFLFDHLYRGIFPLILIVSDSVGFWFPSFHKNNHLSNRIENGNGNGNGNGNLNGNGNINTRKSFHQNRNNHGVWGLVDKKLLQSQGVTEIKMNPIASSLLKKTIKKINQAENLRLSETSIQLLTEQSTGDIRQAINILQMVYLDLKAEQYGIVSKYKEKIRKINHKVNQNKKKNKNAKNNLFHNSNNENQQFSRDAGLTIFHSLGKIIYQKRLPLLKKKSTTSSSSSSPLSSPSTFSSSSPSPSTSFVETALSNNFLVDSTEWGQLQFDPENVIERTNLTPSSFLIHLHGNFLTYFEEIEHAAFAFKDLTTVDAMITRLWNEKNTLIRAIIAGISARSVIIANYETMHLKNKQQKYSATLFHRVKFFEKTKEKNKNKHQISSLFENTTDKDGNDEELINNNSLNLRNINKRSFVLDLMPYLGRELNYSIKMTDYQRNVINSIGRFPHRFAQKRTDVAQINISQMKDEIQKNSYLDIDDIEEISD
ncbi:cell cycle checkpoint protein rad17 [Anaeramoeba flamelloides]|uniref:Cell cycle checkpoint protein rad17 n=1 Tax=Anaeramoeba flamelloides TaxID=1746091 RepID=A0AAV7ZZK1_9EUKA|nr:cell cycle checkpoint protein rad17 [Anaeramoeba flamelloides]